MELNPASRTLRSREHDWLLRTWNHTLHVEPTGPGRCRYRDTVELDAGAGDPSKITDNTRLVHE